MSDTFAQQITTLKDAIQALETQRSALGDAVVDASIAALQHQIAELEAQAEPVQQRKLVTILFMDVVGSTGSISARLDPEDTLEIMDRSLKRLARPIAEHGGHVTRFMGDGFLAIFGSPIAHENDAELALRAGLDILREAVLISTELQAKWRIPSFQVRVGVHTGLAALGGLTEAEDTIMGGTVNLAARLESAAPPGAMLISHETYKHVRGIFNIQPHEPVIARGFDEPITVYLVQAAKPRAFHLPTRGVEGVETGMVGRQDELRSLQDAISNVLEHSTGQAMTILGDAGVGKSRLLLEFQNWVELLPDTFKFYQARAHQLTHNQPYALLRELIMDRFQIQEDDPMKIVNHKIEDGFGEVFGSDADGLMRAHYIGQLLGFDFQASPHIQELQEDVQGLRDRALLALDAYFHLASSPDPLLLFFEDIHWADDSSLGFIHLMMRKLSERCMFVVCLARPTLLERLPLWGEGMSAHRFIHLMPLTNEESHQLVDEILKKAVQIPAMLHALIDGEAEGNPFYIEELIKMLIEGRVIIKGEETWRIEPDHLTQLKMPSSLTGVLQARLDSLPPHERLILQRASVIGRNFWDRMLANLHSGEENLLEIDNTAALASLIQKELIFHQAESAFAGASEYLFKHAILHDVTYETVLKRKRRVYHAQAAKWLIENTADRSGEFSGIISDHLEHAGKNEEAVIYLIQAAERATRQFANSEAIHYYSRALALIPEVDLEAHYDLLLAREKVLDVLGDRQLQESDLSSLKQIALKLDDVCKRAQVALRRVIFYNHTGNFPAILEMMDEAIQLAQQAQDVRCEGALQMQWGIALWRQGKFTSARPTLEQALSMAQAAHLDTIAGDGIRTLGPGFARVLAEKHSSARFEQALEKYRQAGDRRGEAYTLNNLGTYFAEFKGNPSKAREYHEAALPIWREIGDRRGEGLTIFNLGMNAAESGEYDQAVKWLSDSLDIRRQIADRWGERSTLTSLGECHFHLGEYDRVLHHYDQALSIAEEIGDCRGKVITQSLLGNFYRDLGDFTRAQSHYDLVLGAWGELDQEQDRAEFLFSLGLMLYQSRKDQAALKYCQEGLELILGGDFFKLECTGMIVQGHCYSSLGMLKEAEIAYKKASAKASKWRRPLQDFEASAGFARVLLAQAKPEQALLRLEKLLAHIQRTSISGTRSPLDGALEPLHIYLTCFQVLRANRDTRAPGVIAKAYELLQARAIGIEDGDLRSAYLEEIPVHRQIQSEYRH